MGSRALIIVAIGMVGACPTASAADWTVDGGDKPHTIALGPCLRATANSTLPEHEDGIDKVLRHRRCDRGNDAIGRLTLVVRNAGDKPLRLQLRYARTDGRSATLPGDSDMARLWIARPPSLDVRHQIHSDINHQRLSDAIRALSMLPTGTAQDRPRVRKRIEKALRSRGHPDLSRLAAAFALLTTTPASNAVLTRDDAADLLKLIKRAGSGAHPTRLKRVVDRAFAIAVARSAVVVPPQSATSLPVRFRLPGSRPSSLLTGVIQVHELSPGSAIVTVPVDAAVPDVKTVTALPAAITLKTAHPKSARINLVGADVASLVVAGRARPGGTLRNAEGHEAKIAIDRFTRYLADRNRAWAYIKVDGKEPEPGEYSGDIALFRSAPDGPKVAVTVLAGRKETDGLLLMGIGFLAVLVVMALIARSRQASGRVFAAAAGVAAATVAGVFHFAIFGPTWGSTTDVWLAIGLASATTALFLIVVSPQPRRRPIPPRR
jgi:hypothetical protein